MLPQKQRLQKEKEIEEILKKGRSQKEAFLLLKSIKNVFENSRFGFIVSQKVSKNASTRNKVKRRLREIIQKNMGEIVSGRDILFITLPGIDKATFKELEDLTEKLLTKAGLLVK